MTVKELKEILDEYYDDDAKVVIVDWGNGYTYDLSVGGDDEDEGESYCRIGII